MQFIRLNIHYLHEPNLMRIPRPFYHQKTCCDRTIESLITDKEQQAHLEINKKGNTCNDDDRSAENVGEDEDVNVLQRVELEAIATRDRRCHLHNLFPLLLPVLEQQTYIHTSEKVVEHVCKLSPCVLVKKTQAIPLKKVSFIGTLHKHYQ